MNAIELTKKSNEQDAKLIDHNGDRDGSCGSYICKHYSGWESEDKR